MTKKKHNFKEANVLYCGDSKDILKKIPDNSVDLIYLDPPFFSHKHYEGFWDDENNRRLKTQFSDEKWEKLKRSIKPNIMKIYEHLEERWKGGKAGIYVYIAYMRERLEQCWRVLKPTGSIYLHCDWHAGHYLKIMMDEVFGYEHFKNEIVWHYFGFKRSTAGKFPMKHDTIISYSKSKKDTWNVQYKPHRTAYLKRFKKDKEGRLYRDDVNPTKGGRRVIYLDKVKGDIVDSVWDDINPVNPMAKERLGYPTQKPEALSDRIIQASSNKGDIVLDPFMGGASSLASAIKLKRNFIGIDISRTACRVARERLGKIFEGEIKEKEKIDEEKKIQIFGAETLEDIKKMDPHKVAELIIRDRWDGTVNPRKTGDLGIDGWVEQRTIPVQVKRWKNNVGRPEIDKFKTAVERDKKKKGIIVANGFSKDSKAEVARIKAQHKIEIELVEFKNIFTTHNKSHSHNHGKEHIDHPLMMIL